MRKIYSESFLSNQDKVTADKRKIRQWHNRNIDSV